MNIVVETAYYGIALFGISTRSVQNVQFQNGSKPKRILVSVHYTGFIKFVCPPYCRNKYMYRSLMSEIVRVGQELFSLSYH